MDAETFTDYVRKYRNTVFRVAYSYSGSLQDSEDITQEAFLKLYKSEERFTADENVKAWLIRVSANEAKNFIRRNALRRKEPISENIPEEDYELSEIMKGLKRDYRVVIYLHYYEGYSVKELSKILKISESNVKVRLKRGRDKLKELITEKGE